LQTATIPQLEAAMASGRLTSRQLTQAYLDRISYFDHGCVKVNAIRTLTDNPLGQADAADAARRAGRTGPLLGIPAVLKDNIGTTDADTTAGSIALAGNRPPKDSVLASQLRAAGAVILAKTNLSEFANWVSLTMPNGFSSLGGQVLNPYTRGDPSGSSSGSAAGGTLAYAAGTFGSETSGSVLSPSAANSMVGIKPTLGVVSRNGIIPLAHSYDTAGPITRDVTDAAVLLTAASPPDPTDPVFLRAPGSAPPGHDYTAALNRTALRGARIGYSPADVSALASDAQAVFTRALNDMTAAGAMLIPFDTLRNTSIGGLTDLGGIFSEFKFGINDYLAHQAGPTGPHGRPALVTDDLTGIIVYNQQNSARLPYGQNLLIASDATPGASADDPSSAATIIGARATIDSAFSQNGISAYVGANADYADIGAAANYPSVDVPIGYTDNGVKPMGMQILGRAWTEPALIGYAYSYEQATHRRVPPTVADPKLVCAATSATPTVVGNSVQGNLPNTSTLPGGLALGAISGGLLASAWAALRRRLATKQL
ncbi:MAG: amidase family protein, partial [Candidatus Dormibacteraeota bacterium]|nr:amidase family protein [Candidatus Dormibacteraeota bacterium]